MSAIFDMSGPKELCCQAILDCFAKPMGTSASVSDDRIPANDIKLDKSFIENNTSKISKILMVFVIYSFVTCGSKRLCYGSQPNENQLRPVA